MRTTVTIDDELLAKAKTFAGTNEVSAVVRRGLEALVQREAAHRLIRLGGSEPGLEHVPRRRPPTFTNEASDYPDRDSSERKSRRKQAAR